MTACWRGRGGGGPYEVKTGAVSATDLPGLLEFVRRFPEYRPLLICEADGRVAGERAGIDVLTWQEFLPGGPPGQDGSSRRG